MSSLTVLGKNACIGNHGITHFGAGPTATTELASGSYARQPVTIGAPSGGQVVTTDQQDIPVEDGDTVRFIHGYTAVSGGEHRLVIPNGASDWRPCTVDAATDTIHCRDNPYADGDLVCVVSLMGLPVPGGLAEWDFKYVVNRTEDTLQLEDTIGGGAVAISADGAIRLVKCREDAFTGPGTLQVAAGTTIPL